MVKGFVLFSLLAAGGQEVKHLLGTRLEANLKVHFNQCRPEIGPGSGWSGRSRKLSSEARSTHGQVSEGLMKLDYGELGQLPKEMQASLKACELYARRQRLGIWK
jgi:hypothetical protein